MTEEEFYLEDLKSKFLKINPTEYYLSYSGGRDSHFLYWFLKIWLKENDYDMYLKYKIIPIISINTRLENTVILRRMINNADKILLPKMTIKDVIKKYGTPCFTKQQDEYIHRYQIGNRSDNTMNVVMRLNKSIILTVKAKNMLLEGSLPKIHNICCKKIKKDTIHIYEKKSCLKSITGMRSSESNNRKNALRNGCFNSKRTKFRPIHDLTENILLKCEKYFNIEVPYIYEFISQGGCSGCPYGCNSRRCNTEKELKLLNPIQRKYVIELFKPAYDILGVNYKQFLDNQNE